MSLAARLKETIQAGGVAVDEVIIGRPTDRSTWRVDPSSLQAAAQSIINAFDDSEAAQAAWEEDKQPQRKAIRQAAAAAIAANDTFIALANPTAAQVAAHVERLAQQNNAIIRRLVQLE